MNQNSVRALRLTFWPSLVFIQSVDACPNSSSFYAYAISASEKSNIVFRGVTEKQSLETIILCSYVLWNGGKPPSNRSVFTQVL